LLLLLLLLLLRFAIGLHRLLHDGVHPLIPLRNWQHPLPPRVARAHEHAVPADLYN
jgi:hypothetical protein